MEFELLNWPVSAGPYNMPFVVSDSNGTRVHIVRTGTSLDFQQRAAELMVLLGVATANAASQPPMA